MTSTATAAANHLTARWVRAACTGGATVVSGAIVWPLLALLAAAADGAGRSQLAAAVGVDAAEADRHARALLDVLAGSESVAAALGVWTHAAVPLEPWWRAAAPAGARGELRGDPATDQAALDQWVARHTGGLLDHMPVALDQDTLMVLAAALCVRTRWRDPFEDVSLLLGEGPWAGRELAGLARGAADLDQVAVAATPAGPVTLLAVEGVDDVDVQLVLGEQARAAGEVLAAGVEAVAGHHRVRRGAALLDGEPAPGLEVMEYPDFDDEPKVRASTVRFSIAASHDLAAHAELFGLAAVGDPSAGHFPRISRRPLALQQARQDATATFSADGFEAAAVTAAAMRVGGFPARRSRSLVVSFHRPFGFVARQRASGLVLVAGWVADPQAWPGDDVAGIEYVSP